MLQGTKLQWLARTPLGGRPSEEDSWQLACRNQGALFPHCLSFSLSLSLSLFVTSSLSHLSIFTHPPNLFHSHSPTVTRFLFLALSLSVSLAFSLSPARETAQQTFHKMLMLPMGLQEDCRRLCSGSMWRPKPQRVGGPKLALECFLETS